MIVSAHSPRQVSATSQSRKPSGECQDGFRVNPHLRRVMRARQEYLARIWATAAAAAEPGVSRGDIPSAVGAAAVVAVEAVAAAEAAAVEAAVEGAAWRARRWRRWWRWWRWRRTLRDRRHKGVVDLGADSSRGLLVGP